MSLLFFGGTFVVASSIDTSAEDAREDGGCVLPKLFEGGRGPPAVVALASAAARFGEAFPFKGAPLGCVWIRLLLLLLLRIALMPTLFPPPTDAEADEEEAVGFRTIDSVAVAFERFRRSLFALLVLTPCLA